MRNAFLVAALIAFAAPAFAETPAATTDKTAAADAKPAKKAAAKKEHKKKAAAPAEKAGEKPAPK
jgi:hypothetical protein